MASPRVKSKEPANNSSGRVLSLGLQHPPAQRLLGRKMLNYRIRVCILFVRSPGLGRVLTLLSRGRICSVCSSISPVAFCLFLPGHESGTGYRLSLPRRESVCGCKVIRGDVLQLIDRVFRPIHLPNVLTKAN